MPVPPSCTRKARSQKVPIHDCKADGGLTWSNFQRQSSPRALSGESNNYQGVNLVDENAVCHRFEILRAAVVLEYA
jgi:hypothetical protein